MARISAIGIITSLALSAMLVGGVLAASEPYAPRIDPANFSANVDNPYFTLRPGTTWTYKSKGEDASEINKVTVTDQTRQVMGVTTRVVWDRVWHNGQLVEETYDWYAQDKEGNVWYFGEASTAFKDGKKAGTKGSWEGGRNGAQPGIVMPAKAKAGTPYRQEYLKGEAEDMAQIVSVKETVTTPYGSFKDCLKTKDWSPLERGTTEHKYYAKEVGNVVLETEDGDKKRVELVEATTGSPDKSEKK